ncbi:oligopeptide ABC transporter substrate-binding protein [Enterococcus casseliflavus]|uniref:oligopeptide ABC transporter substrate-binding protein n=1 Tax=Enterococcus casseliflavus TaxID=37734 RepID=UPI00143337A2|nr:oligopeptide ABC transporter substrate-binding protein [Enterococcus casseliflavus]NKD28004.1 oligopeptide ABC transporter substrate-binding protein [Enterococcus casseliflavus]
MKKNIFGMVTLLSVLALAACGSNGGGTDSSGGGNAATETEDISTMPVEVSNDEEAIEGGTLDVAVVMDTQFQGLFVPEFYQDSYDSYFMEPSNETLFLYDSDFKIVDGGAANLELDEDNNTATITLRDNLKWSDGEDVTSDDVIFSYEVIGHKDYTGIRYDNNFTNIVGMEDYHDGKADTISGITKESDKVVKIQYKEVHPGMLQAGGGVYESALPKHAFEGIEVKDMESSDPVRKNPVVFGPYVMSNIVAGESVEYVPNEYYYGGAPKMDKLSFKAVPSASIVEGLNAKQYDVVYSMPTDTYPTYKDVDGYQILGRPEQAYTYLGFKLGTWNEEENKVNYNPESKMADKALRQAMGYAIDNDAVGSRFYNGLRSNATTLIPPVFGTLHNTEVEGYTLNIDKANQLLDDAGYKDVDGDGMREDKNGEKLTINFASMSGGETAQPLSDYYIQQWNEIGLDVQYTTGRLIDFQAFYDKLKNDDPEIDVFQAAWGTGSDPSPSGLYGPNAAFNYTRFESEENTKLLDAIDSKDSFDDAKRKEAFDAWQEYAANEAFVIPTLYRNQVMPVSNRVKDFSWAYDIDHNRWATVSVTAESR